uniref:Uncharacterized protein n=1 Tax=Oryza brachyantha TaxID=4533 RepID=J3LX17_ORYBR
MPYAYRKQRMRKSINDLVGSPHGQYSTASRYMYLSGRFDMAEVERTVHRLIRSGMAVDLPCSPYHAFIYTAFQELIGDPSSRFRLPVQQKDSTNQCKYTRKSKITS